MLFVFSRNENKILFLLAIGVLAITFTLESMSLKHHAMNTPIVIETEAKKQQQVDVDDDQLKILVAFTGPSSPKKKSDNNDNNDNKLSLYEKNTDFFLQYGMDHCNRHDTLLVVGRDHYHDYQERIQELQKQCSKKVIMVTRRNVCFDMETVRMVYEDGAINGITIGEYDAFVYINCGVTGPHPDHRETWFDQLLSPLLGNDDDIAMSGLSLNCGGSQPHLQSMMYALTRGGIELVRDLPFDCVERKKADGSETNNMDIVFGYEVPMGARILGSGSGLAQPFVGQLGLHGIPGLILPENQSDCNHGHLWMDSDLADANGGEMPSFSQLGFWKSSRNLPEEIVRLLNYTES